MKKTILLTSLSLLCACTDATLKKEANGSYTIRYEHEALYSIPVGQQKLNEAALRACGPKQWQVVSEYHNIDEASFGLSEWTINCSG